MEEVGGSGGSVKVVEQIIGHNLDNVVKYIFV